MKHGVFAILTAATAIAAAEWIVPAHAGPLPPPPPAVAEPVFNANVRIGVPFTIGADGPSLTGAT